MDRKAARERLPTSRVGRHDGAPGERGFTLLEIVCVLAIVALLAAVLLPGISGGTSRPRLEAYALEVASVLKADRSTAIRRRVAISSDIDAPRRFVRSGSNGHLIRIPNDVLFNAVLPERCDQRPAFSAITFFPSGMSCGGALVLTRLGVGYEIRVNWLTGGVEVVPRNSF
jgi:general secretion pathway protein H